MGKTAKNEENPRKSRVFRLASFLSTRVGGATRYFAFGEYTHVLRLTSELVDLRTGYANPISRVARGWVRRAGAKKGELQSSSPFLAPATGIEPITNP